ncbi:MAG: hypothetical protein ILP10_08190 [Lachnospiraceae bacterium]|nr:hypothetical protein [Lachnospiraceae bacterium]
MSIGNIGNKGFPGIDRFKGAENTVNKAGKDSKTKAAGNLFGDPAAKYDKKAGQIPGTPDDVAGARIGKGPKAEAFDEASLSDAAKEYLAKLRSTYGDIEFSVARFANDEEADDIIAHTRTSKSFVALIDPDTLEKMAKDSEAAARFEELLGNAGTEFEKITEGLGEDAKDIEKMSIIVDGEGNLSYSVTMRNNEALIKGMREGAEKAKEAREARQARAEKEKSSEKAGKPDAHPADKKGSITFKASTIEELRELIFKQIEANKAALAGAGAGETAGGSLDLTV